MEFTTFSSMLCLHVSPKILCIVVFCSTKVTRKSFSIQLLLVERLRFPIVDKVGNQRVPIRTIFTLLHSVESRSSGDIRLGAHRRPNKAGDYAVVAIIVIFFAILHRRLALMDNLSF